MALPDEPDSAGRPTRVAVSDTAQIVSLNLYHFTPHDLLWVLGQMAVAHLAMRFDGLEFYRLVGSGSDQGFSPRPNLARFGILTAWQTLPDARRAQAHHPVLARWRRRARGEQCFLFTPTAVKGSWGKRTPFRLDRKAPAATGSDDGPIVSITRARLRTNAVRPFWSRVGAISEQVADAHGLRYKVGIGEVPWLNQITFSIWDSSEALDGFAKHAAHGAAARAAYSRGWFKNSLFARFALVDSTIGGDIPA